MMRWVLVVWSMVVLFPCATPAQNIDSETAETIRALKQEVKELKARVTALEAQKEQPPSQSKPSEAAKPQEAAAAAEAEGANSERVSGIFPGIKISGFGTVNYKATDGRPPETGLIGFPNFSNNGFAVGDVD